MCATSSACIAFCTPPPLVPATYPSVHAFIICARCSDHIDDSQHTHHHLGGVVANLSSILNEIEHSVNDVFVDVVSVHCRRSNKKKASPKASHSEP
jgi:hypothetical protein